jgi:hypothetical protein
MKRSRGLAAVVRKLSGFTSPSKANEAAFDCAIDEQFHKIGP